MTVYGHAELGTSLYGASLSGDVLSNLGFEDGTYGDAALWTRNDFAAAAFAAATGGEEPIQGPYVFPPGIAASFVGAITAESFEAGWSNDAYMRTTFPGAVSPFASGRFAEDFTNGWSNDVYRTQVADAPWLWFGAPLADGTDVEDFENGWSNDAYAFTLGATSAAVFYNVRAASFEGFQFFKAPQAYTANTTTDALGTNGHGLAVNYRVVLAGPVAGSMPAPLAPAVTYYVQNVPDANSFKLAQTASAGSPIDITTAGTGLLAWSAPYEHWTTLMATV